MGTVYLCYGQKGSLIMSDTHLALAVVFDVPEGQDFKSYFPKFYATVKGGTKDCLYYGFATCGSKVLCREGYKGAPGLLAQGLPGHPHHHPARVRHPRRQAGRVQGRVLQVLRATKNGPGAAGCLYYGFGFAGDSMYCREGYKTAEDCAKHGADVKEMIEEPMKAVGAGNFKLNVVGPAAELEKLKPKLAPRGAIFWELDSGSLWL